MTSFVWFERQGHIHVVRGIMLISWICLDADVEAHDNEVPVLRGLSILDRFLVVWIVLAMAIGILLGNFVEEVGPSLQRGKFVGVSVPIGMFTICTSASYTGRGRSYFIFEQNH